jgi:thiol-disulfide isomerase/thioredoxin
MNSLRLFLFISLSILSSNFLTAQEWVTEDVIVYEKFDELEQTFILSGDSVHLINFWATWCKPCVEELPYFEEAREALADENIKFTLVSLDFKRQIEKKMIPFLNEHKIGAEVVVLTDGKSNVWIDKVDPSWSGAIPITVIKKGDKHLFFEQEFHSTEELLEKIKLLL